jgi:hypothetical protein
LGIGLLFVLEPLAPNLELSCADLGFDCSFSGQPFYFHKHDLAHRIDGHVARWFRFDRPFRRQLTC